VVGAGFDVVVGRLEVVVVVDARVDVVVGRWELVVGAELCVVL